ncbi:MAG: amino acid permease [Deltaproteobacteria bacterium]|nr:amino acid permease [Deltaproteobacteria bacterium]
MDPMHQDLADDTHTLRTLGYQQELDRRMSGFSNFAISFSIICILAGGLTSFHLGFSAVGGAAIGLGWPLSCAFSLIVAAAMGQLASAFPTAGGLYHWSAILGGRAWGWATAWLNLVGLITTLAAINVGAFAFTIGAIDKIFEMHLSSLSGTKQIVLQTVGVALMTGSQGLVNHLGIKLTTKLTDFSGYLIMVIATILTGSLVFYGASFDLSRLVSFQNFSGSAGGNVWPANDNILVLFALGLLLPAYTITGFDASAHTSEETKGAQYNVPRGIVRAALVSSVGGWLMLIAMVLAMPSVTSGAAEGPNVFFWLVEQVLPKYLGNTLLIGIIIAQYICGLATVTSTSRMTYAFARDGGLPFSRQLKQVSPRYLTPASAIWTIVTLTIAFAAYTPVYTTITVCCVIFLYISYVIPIGLGFFVYGKSWTNFGPWTLGIWFKPACLVAMFGCLALILIGIQPPNDKALTVLLTTLVIMAVVWVGLERHRFQGAPVTPLTNRLRK